MKLTAKRLEDAALSYRGEERVQLLHRWLVALKETQRAAGETQEPQPGDDPNQSAPLLVCISACCFGCFACHLNCTAESCDAGAVLVAGSLRGL